VLALAAAEARGALPMAMVKVATPKVANLRTSLFMLLRSRLSADQ
jgi:hypothetical protein